MSLKVLISTLVIVGILFGCGLSKPQESSAKQYEEKWMHIEGKSSAELAKMSCVPIAKVVEMSDFTFKGCMAKKGFSLKSVCVRNCD